MFIKLVHGTSCNTEGLGKLQNKVQLQEEIISRLMNRERVENTLVAIPVDPLYKGLILMKLFQRLYFKY